MKNAKTGKWEVEVTMENGEPGVVEFASVKDARAYIAELEAQEAPDSDPDPEGDQKSSGPEESPEKPAEDENDSLVARVMKLIAYSASNISSKLRKVSNDLGKTESEILFHLVEGGMPQKDLASKLNTSSSNVGQAIYKLEDADLVESKRSKEDRRCFDIYLTEKGAATKTEVMEAREAAVESAFADFEEGELETLAGLLNKLN